MTGAGARHVVAVVVDDATTVVAHAVEPAGGITAVRLDRHGDYFFLPLDLPLPLPFALAAAFSASAVRMA